MHTHLVQCVCCRLSSNFSLSS